MERIEKGGLATLALLLTTVTLPSWGRNTVSDAQVKTLQVTVNDDWRALPVARLGSDDVVRVSFDVLTHESRRYRYRLEHCEADWTTTEELFEADWLAGFNDNEIEDYERSLNTTVLYTHYTVTIPNERCRLTMSGNYRMHIVDEDTDNEVACAEFMVAEPLMTVGMSVTSNTDMDFNGRHQQVKMTVNYGTLRVTDPEGQVQTVVLQNGREATWRRNTAPDVRTATGLRWEHCRDLIFDAGNEYRKYEVLALSHATMGIDRMAWNGTSYDAYPVAAEPRRHYVYDEDADGAFYIRYSDNVENDRTCDYVWVNYRIGPARDYGKERVLVDGAWTTGDEAEYTLEYDAAECCYHGKVLQKQGYYNYQFVVRDEEGRTVGMEEEGSFFETENRYDALVYYRGVTDRTWRLTGHQSVVTR